MGENHPDVASSLNGLAELKAKLSEPDSALALMRQSLKIDDRTIQNVFSGASERVKFTFLSTLENHENFLFSLVLKQLIQNCEAVTTCLDVILQRKGMVLEALAQERISTLATDDNQIQQVLQQYKTVSSRLANLTFSDPGETELSTYSQRLAQLQSEKEKLEEKLARFSQAFQIKRKIGEVNYQTINQCLPHGSVLVEYVCPRMFNFKETNWEEHQYLAFVLSAGDSSIPVMVDLGPASVIDKEISKFRQLNTEKSIRALGEAKAENILAESGKRLYELIFAPIKHKLGDSKELFIAPDGELNLIPFAALQDKNGTYLIAEYQFNYLSSGRDLLRYEQQIAKGKSTIILADPLYDLTDQEQQIASAEIFNKKNQDTTDIFRNLNRHSKDFFLQKAKPLPGTRREAEGISNLLNDEEVHLFFGKEALEEVIKRLKPPHRLHIATHGFFFEEEDKTDFYNQKQMTMLGSSFQRPIRIENPLLRSGLLLAGANNLDKRQTDSKTDDGILTALEISGLNLWGTDLVVLSACGTGLGDVRRGEGVFGLRRAFQLAGARTVVMSLWNIYDTVAPEIMTDFYSRIKAGVGKSKALQQASLAYMQKRRATNGAAHPYFWAAFVCVGEP